MRPYPLVLAAALLSACQSDDPFSQIGYFKDAGPNRVFVLHADTATPEQAGAAADRLMTTSGQMMIAYLFTGPEIPADVVTQARDYMAANSAMFDQPAPWRWRYVVKPDGSSTLTDCETTASAADCK